MSFQQDLAFFVQALSRLADPAAPDVSMITVVTGRPESFAPDLFQVYKMHDGTYVVREIGEMQGEEDHHVLSDKVVLEKDIKKIPEMCTKSGPITLQWGPKVLMSA